MKRFECIPSMGGVYTIKDNYEELGYLRSFYTYDKSNCEKFVEELNNHLLFEPPFFSTLVGSPLMKESMIKRFIQDNYGVIDGLNVLLLEKSLIITCVSDEEYDVCNLGSFYELLGLNYYSSAYYMDSRVYHLNGGDGEGTKYMYYIYVLNESPVF